jgi:lipid-A-disaccharide synthase
MGENSSTGNFKSSKQKLHLAVLAGEVSGDMHAAAVVSALQNLCELSAFGMGGTHLRAQAVETIIDSESNAGGVMGFVDVLRRIPAIFSSLARIRAELASRRPDAVLLVDYPGFNLRVAKAAHALGIPVFYFIIPKMWVWKAGRIELFKRFVTHSFTIFPFEHSWLTSRGFNRNSFVGHPIATQLAARPIDRLGMRAALGVQPNEKLVLVLPGSRKAELDRHIPLACEVAKLLRTRMPNVKLLAPVAPSQRQHRLWPLARAGGIETSTESSIDLMRCADAGLIKSGTSTLEAAACGLPSIMFYTASALTTFIVRSFIRSKDYSLPNIVKPETMLELTQEQAMPERIVSELENLLSVDGAGAAKQRYASMLQVLNGPAETDSDATGSPYERVARELLERTPVRR